jgi:Na+/glutamate symporter
MAMEITYSLTEADVLALNKFRAQTDPLLKKRIVRARNRLTISFAIVGVGFWLLVDDLLILIYFLALSIISFLFYYQYYEWRIRRQVRETYKQPNYSSSLAPRTLEATAEGLVNTSAIGQMKVEWNQVDDFFETPTHIFISVGQVISVPIPKNTSGLSAVEIDAFVSACRSLKQQAA